MTDKKIIKALEHCGIECKCNGCPLDDSEFVSNCIDDLCKNALDLINRQKAEIERLEKEVKDKERAYNDEFCWRKEWQTKCRELLKEKQTAKSDAIKEFADRLKDKADKTRIYNIENEKVVFYMDEFKLDKLIKEMTLNNISVGRNT